MRAHELERALSTIPRHPKPKVELEQYATPADVAAPLLFEAFALGDLEGKTVADLGAGTGVLSIGSALMGGRVIAVETDEDAITVARSAAEKHQVTIEFWKGDVSEWRGNADTVVMNPPFGAQNKGADRAFLDAALRAAPVVYSMHNAVTRAFVEAYVAERGFSVTHRWAMRMRLAHQYAHQSRASQDIDVIAFRFVKNESSIQA